MRFDPFTRLLHLLLASGVTLQLLLSLFMVDPRPDRPADLWFEIHQAVGFALFVVLPVHWLWSLSRSYGGDFGMLMPWFSRRRLDALRNDLHLMAREFGDRRIPSAETQRPLPAAVEGLGLLTASYMALSGALWSLLSSPNGGGAGLPHFFKESHQLVANAMWVYVIGHAGMAMLHQLGGEPILRSMFGFGKDRRRIP